MDLDTRSVAERKLAERQRTEQAFHDKVARGGSADFWTFGATDAPDAYQWETLGDLHGKNVLEIGCGDGSTTARFARAGAFVTAIDISGEMVAMTRERMAREGLSERVTALRQGAEELDVPPDSFDVVFGHAVLHHLDQGVVIPKIARALRPGGLASFLDPLAHNPVLNLMRRRTPGMRTPTERPISCEEIATMALHFREYSTREFHLVALGAYFWFYAIKSERLFRSTIRSLTQLDRLLFALVPRLRRYAWITIITFEK